MKHSALMAFRKIGHFPGIFNFKTKYRYKISMLQHEERKHSIGRNIRLYLIVE